MSYNAEGKWVCPFGKCEGNGRVRNPETRCGENCDCWPLLTAARALDGFSGVPGRFQGKDFARTDPRPEAVSPNWNQVFDFVKAYARDWKAMRARGRGLAILSSVSNIGKTHMACALMQELIRDYWIKDVEHQDLCFFTETITWFRLISLHYLKFPVLPQDTPQRDEQVLDQKCRSSSDALAVFEERLLKTELLVIDDLSKFPVEDAKKLGKVFDVVGARVNAKLPIIITDNEPTMAALAKKLGETYGASITNRILDSCDVLTIDGPAETRGRKKGSKRGQAWV